MSDEQQPSVTRALHNSEMAKELLGCPGWAWFKALMETRVQALAEEVVFTDGLKSKDRLRKAAAAKELRVWIAFPETQKLAARRTLEASDKGRVEV